MRFDGIGRQTDQFDAALGEFGFEFCEGAQLGGADWSVIFGMREEDSPLVTDPFMEVNGSCSGLCLEIRGDRAKTKAVENVRM